jgi:Asp-tRNA(Asn)/Glu-tRNA(Gln) amidotransferase A subunit family amidase
LDVDGNEPLSVGILESYWTDGFAPPLDRVVTQLCNRANFSVTRINSSLDWPAILADHRVIMAVEAAQVHYQPFMRWRHEFGPNVAVLIEEGLQTPPEVYRRALDLRAERLATFDDELGRCSALLLPATAGSAPDLTTTADPRYNSPLSYLGVPCITLPACTDEFGLPLGLQLASCTDDNWGLLFTARIIERSLPPRANPALLSNRHD